MTISNSHGYTIYSNRDIHDPSGSILALGSFDGVHIAHRQLLLETHALKNELSARLTGAWCFSSSPAEVIRQVTPERLSSIEEKVKLMLDCGLDFVVVADFYAFMGMSAEDFAGRLLRENFGAVGVVCGYNFKFGRGGLGTHELLRGVFGEDSVRVIPAVCVDGLPVSSSRIRACISDGDVETAALLLGRRFALESPVYSGKQLGRKIGFPTANQFFPRNGAIPHAGIYATLCRTEDGKDHIGVSNVGIRPTIVDGTDDHMVNCETYLIDFSDDLYGKVLRVEFCKFLRPEQKFSSIDELRSAIEKDAENASAYFSERK